MPDPFEDFKQRSSTFGFSVEQRLLLLALVHRLEILERRVRALELGVSGVPFPAPDPPPKFDMRKPGPGRPFLSDEARSEVNRDANLDG